MEFDPLTGWTEGGLVTHIPKGTTPTQVALHGMQLINDAETICRQSRFESSSPSDDATCEQVQELLSVVNLRRGLDEGRDHPYTKIDALEGGIGTGKESDPL